MFFIGLGAEDALLRAGGDLNAQSELARGYARINRSAFYAPAFIFRAQMLAIASARPEHAQENMV